MELLTSLKKYCPILYNTVKSSLWAQLLDPWLGKRSRTSSLNKDSASPTWPKKNFMGLWRNLRMTWRMALMSKKDGLSGAMEYQNWVSMFITQFWENTMMSSSVVFKSMSAAPDMSKLTWQAKKVICRSRKASKLPSIWSKDHLNFMLNIKEASSTYKNQSAASND